MHPAEVQPIEFGMSFNLILNSQSYWSLFNEIGPKQPKELDHQLRFETQKK